MDAGFSGNPTHLKTSIYELVSQALALILTAGGAAVLAGWLFNAALLQNISPDHIAMKVNSALSFVLTGIVFLILNNKRLPNGLKLMVTNILGSVVALIGLLTLIEYAFRLNLGIDQLLISDKISHLITVRPGRMSANSAFNFVLLGAATLLSLKKEEAYIYIGQLSALAAGIIGLLAFVGYLYGAAPLILGFSFSEPMSFMSTVLFMAACVCVCFAGSRSGIMKTISSGRTGGKMLRAILPVVLVTPLLLGFLKLWSQKFLILSNETGVSLVAVMNLLVMLAIIYIFARLVNIKEENQWESEEKFTTIFEKSTVGISLATIDGKVLNVNKAFADMLGYSVKEIISKGIFDVTLPEDAEETKQYISRLVNREIESCRYEKRYVHKTGKIIYADLSSTLLFDEHGRPLFMVTSISDITERKSTEKALRESEEKYKRLVETTYTGYVILDDKGNVLEANNEYLRMTGRKNMKDIVGHNVLEWTASHDLEHNGNEVKRCLNQGFVHGLEIDYVSPEGAVTPIEINATVFRTEGKDHILTLCHDITGRKMVLNALKASEEKFRKAFATSPDSININRLSDGLYVSINSGFTKITGYTEGDCLGKTSLELNIWDDPANRKNFIESLKRDGYVENFEARFRAKDGRVIIGLMSGSVIDLNGVPHNLNITRDITERKRVENELILSEAEWRTTFDAISDSICLISLEGRILRHNAATETMLGKTYDQIIGQYCFTVIHGSSSPTENCPIERMKRTKRRESMQLKLNDKWYNIIADPIFDKENNLAGAVHIVQDITDRKRLEEELSNARVMLESAFEQSPIPLVLVSMPDGVVQIMNHACRSYLDTIDEPDPVGQKILDIKTSFIEYDSAGKPIKPGVFSIEHALKGQKVLNREIKIETKNGTTHWALVNSSPIYDAQGKMIAVYVVLLDITERKRMESETIRTQKLDSLGVLSGGIAHDFNNLLTGILGNISLARYSLKPGDGNYELLEDTEKAVKQAKNLTLQLLTFAKGGAPIKKLISLAPIIKEFSTFAVHGSKTVCQYNISPDIYPVEADPGQLGQVISNITINSVQAMPNGGKISISAENTGLPDNAPAGSTSGSYVRIVIKDTGPGIAPDIIDKIFDPYFTTKNNGSGLGLATCYSIIKNHGGFITAEAEPGKGTSIIIYIPAAKGEFIPVERAGEAELIKGSGRVLILDDEEIVRVMGARILKKLGFAVEAFAESGKAVERYRDTWGTGDAFDIVILDLTIPGHLNGKEVLTRMKAVNPNVKAIVSSGYSADPIVANYKEHGFSAALPKPYSVQDMSDVLRTFMLKK